jgi:hypothetical protein
MSEKANAILKQAQTDRTAAARAAPFRSRPVTGNGPVPSSRPVTGCNITEHKESKEGGLRFAAKRGFARREAKWPRWRLG